MKSRIHISLLVVASLILVAMAALELKRRHVESLPANPKHEIVRKEKPDYVLLPESEAAVYANLFSRDAKADLHAWEPTVADMEALESNLSQIPGLSENAHESARHIDNPKEYLRQYVAVVQHGKRWIFVNALCGGDDSGEWRKHLKIAVDGGKCYWHVWYDPATQKFSNLMINAAA